MGSNELYLLSICNTVQYKNCICLYEQAAAITKVLHKAASQTPKWPVKEKMKLVLLITCMFRIKLQTTDTVTKQYKTV